LRTKAANPRLARATALHEWYTPVVAPDAHGPARRLRDAGVPFVSSGVVRLADARLGFTKAFLVRDPDGHVVRVVSP
jgi:hypothetical protein